MRSILDKIFDDKKAELDNTRLHRSLSELKSMVGDAPFCVDVINALAPNRWGTSRIIAELKRKTPFKGELRSNFDPVAIAGDYAQNGAAAISILTESQHFGGSIDFLTVIRERVDIQLLRKYFIFYDF